jgi:hypothetical protein
MEHVASYGSIAVIFVKPIRRLIGGIDSCVHIGEPECPCLPTLNYDGSAAKASNRNFQNCTSLFASGAGKQLITI